jgi:hypothetical protein
MGAAGGFFAGQRQADLDKQDKANQALNLAATQARLEIDRKKAERDEQAEQNTFTQRELIKTRKPQIMAEYEAALDAALKSPNYETLAQLAGTAYQHAATQLSEIGDKEGLSELSTMYQNAVNRGTNAGTLNTLRGTQEDVNKATVPLVRAKTVVEQGEPGYKAAELDLQNKRLGVQLAELNERIQRDQAELSLRIMEFNRRGETQQAKELDVPTQAEILKVEAGTADPESVRKWIMDNRKLSDPQKAEALKQLGQGAKSWATRKATNTRAAATAAARAAGHETIKRNADGSVSESITRPAPPQVDPVTQAVQAIGHLPKEQQAQQVDISTKLSPDQKKAVRQKLGLPEPQSHFNLGPIHF